MLKLTNVMVLLAPGLIFISAKGITKVTVRTHENHVSEAVVNGTNTKQLKHSDLRELSRKLLFNAGVCIGRLRDKVKTLKKEIKHLNLKLNLRPLLEEAKFVILPEWLRSTPSYKKETMWILAIELEINTSAKMLKILLESCGMTPEDFAQDIAYIDEKLPEVAYDIVADPPKTLTKGDWQKICEEVGFTSKKHQKCLRLIIEMIKKIRDMQQLSYTTTLQYPRIGPDYVIHFRNLRVLKGNASCQRKEALKELCGTPFKEHIGNIFFPSKKNRKMSSEVFFTVNNIPKLQFDALLIKLQKLQPQNDRGALIHQYTEFNIQANSLLQVYNSFKMS